MKKTIAIFAITIFFLAQFGRVINFCFCSMAVWQQTNSFACDCEKQFLTALKADSNNKSQPESAISTEQKFDELFQQQDFPAVLPNHSIHKSAWPKSNAEGLYHIFGKNIFHPPLQVS